MMKKLAILLVVILCFSMLGCGPTKQESTEQTLQQLEESIAVTDAPTEATQPSVAATQGDTGGGDVNLLGISTLEDYEKHFEANGGYPDSFITYEDLQELGSFESFICQSYNLMEGARKEYTVYEYGLIAGGSKFKLKFRPAKYELASVTTIEWVDIKDTMIKSDLRTNQTDTGHGVVIFEEYCYKYLDGKLHTIEWIVGETWVTVWFPEGFNEKWPENEPETLIGRMLIWDTAEEALGELREKIDGKLKNLKYPD